MGENSGSATGYSNFHNTLLLAFFLVGFCESEKAGVLSCWFTLSFDVVATIKSFGFHKIIAVGVVSFGWEPCGCLRIVVGYGSEN